jgi:mRNA-degrading endonuclease YafQ of YafQ-DinJ toxin-antitoxin module
LRFVVTKRFENAYRSLPAELQHKTDKALRLLAENPRHPSLRLKKMQGTPDIWEARVDRNCGLTLDIRSDALLLRNVGKHDETLNSP